MPSHLLDNPTKGVYTGVSHLDILGNDRADHLADSAATKACVSLDVSAPVLYYINLVKRIQKRLVAILISLPNRPKPKQERTHVAPPPSVAELSASTTHVLFEHEGRSKCARCLCSYRNNDPSIRHWLEGQCIALESRIDRPLKLEFAHIHLGNTCAHVSHSLYIFKGLIFCFKCGVRAGSFGMKGMPKPCAPPTEYGAQSIAALRQCKKPPNLTSWPSEQTGLQSDTGGNKCIKYKHSRGTFRSGISVSFPRPVPLVCSTPPPSVCASAPQPQLPIDPCRANCPIDLPEYYSTLSDLLELHDAGEPVVWPDGLTAGLAKCAINQKKEELQAELLVAQPQPPLSMDAFRISDVSTLPVIHTKEPSYISAKPLPQVVGFKRRFVRGSEYESHKHRARTTESLSINTDNTRAQASSSAQEIPGPVMQDCDDADMALALSASDLLSSSATP